MRQMLTLTVCLLLMLVFPLAALAQESELQDGFRLGRYAMGAATLSLELSVLREMIGSVDPAGVTDEAYAAGDLTDEELTTAGNVLAYTIWRIEFYIDPVLEAIEEGETFTHPALAEYHGPTMEVLAKVRTACDALTSEKPDFIKLEAFHQDLLAGQYDEALMSLAEKAQAQAGIADED